MWYHCQQLHTKSYMFSSVIQTNYEVRMTFCLILPFWVPGCYMVRSKLQLSWAPKCWKKEFKSWSAHNSRIFLRKWKFSLHFQVHVTATITAKEVGQCSWNRNYLFREKSLFEWWKTVRILSRNCITAGKRDHRQLASESDSMKWQPYVMQTHYHWLPWAETAGGVGCRGDD